MDELHADNVDAVNELSRRSMLGLALAAAAGGTALAIGGLDEVGHASGDEPITSAILAPSSPNLSYLGFDAFAFLDEKGGRQYETLTGSKTLLATKQIWAPLSLPAGTVIREIAASYQGGPIIEISRRPFFDGVPATIPQQVFQQSFTTSPGGPKTTTRTANVIVSADFTYTVSAFLPAGASILGVRIGYQGGFVPFSGATPRVLDTRVAGQGPTLGIGSPRKVVLGMPGRAAVINVTAAGPTGRGNIAAYAGDIAFPGNSSLNFVPGQNVANLVICAMDSTGAINLRAAQSSTDVVVDRIGSII